MTRAPTRSGSAARRGAGAWLTAGALAALLAPVAPSGAAPDAPSARVRALLREMTRADKMAVIRGAGEPAEATLGEAGWIAGVPRLHIPDLRFADGPPGVLVRHASTGMPSTLSMAATFSPAAAGLTGTVIGRDARALGVDVILQPFINLARDPTTERAYNTFGEDPTLTGTLAAAFIRGAQAENVMVQAKHFVAYDGGAAVEVDGQTLREVYVAPFRDAVDADVASIMCAYSTVNGTHACGNATLLTTILREEDGFRGFVTSDWGATHGAEALGAGLDMEQPGTGPTAYFALETEPPVPPMPVEKKAELFDTLGAGVPEEPRLALAPLPEEVQPPDPGLSRNLGEALTRGTLGDADLDRAAARVLGQMERFGWLDQPPRRDAVPEPVAADARAVRQLATQGAVLLKNDGVLPLTRRDLGALALIGPGALQTFAIVVGEEQSFGRAERQVGVVHALTARGLGAGLRVAVGDDMTGEPVPASRWSSLTRTEADGRAIAVADLDDTRRAGRARPAGTAATWAGTLTVPVEGDYDLNLQILGATGRYFVDDRRVGSIVWWGGHGAILFANRDNVVPTTDGLDNVRRRVHLTAGPHPVRVEVTPDDSHVPVQVRLAWVTPELREQTFAAAVAAARAARVAVVFAWNRNRSPFALAGDQDRLIAAVAAANPNTVVVLNTGQPVAMPWLPQVRAVLEMWYTGDEGGWAAADLLTGRANPAGRLPLTWPRSADDGPAHDPAHPERASRGVAGRTVYSEGLDIGYRWYDRQQRAPLYPFGHGLSYTRFEYSALEVAAAADGGLDVRCRIRNAGPRDGDEVVQVYLGAPDPAPAGAQFALRALATFARVSIPAGHVRRVRLHVPATRLQYWSVADGSWHAVHAGRHVYVGRSSRDLPLEATLPASARGIP